MITTHTKFQRNERWNKRYEESGQVNENRGNGNKKRRKRIECGRRKGQWKPSEEEGMKQRLSPRKMKEEIVPPAQLMTETTEERISQRPIGLQIIWRSTIVLMLIQVTRNPLGTAPTSSTCHVAL